MQRLSQGIYYNVPAADYHADPCVAPSLSSGIARTILSHSPAHAWYEHPRLNPGAESDRASKLDRGAIAHALMLRDELNIVIVDAPDWRTKAAQQLKNEAYALGKIPVLGADYAEIEEMVKIGQNQLAGWSHLFSEDGESEATLIWQENDIWLRCRPDWMMGEVIGEYKTTEASANPDHFDRIFFSKGYDIQEAFYRRGVQKLMGIDPNFMFAVQESSPPYALSVISTTPEVRAIAERKVEEAINLWKACLKSDKWPSYPKAVCTLSAPPYVEKAWLEREERQRFLKEGEYFFS